MCNLRTDSSWWRAALLLLAAVAAGCAGKPVSSSAPKVEDRGRALQEIADYALYVRQQSDETLRGELAKLAEPIEAQVKPESTLESQARRLRRALITGQRQSELYDPAETSQALARITGEGPDSSVYVQVAQALLSVLPPETGQCAAKECEEKLSTLVQVEDLRRRELNSRIDSLRGQLESERNQREKLESQLEALKSLEAQIKDRDGPQ